MQPFKLFRHKLDHHRMTLAIKDYSLYPLREIGTQDRKVSELRGTSSFALREFQRRIAPRMLIYEEQMDASAL